MCEQSAQHLMPPADPGWGRQAGVPSPLCSTVSLPEVAPLPRCLCQIVKDHLGCRGIGAVGMFAEAGEAFVSPPLGHQAKYDLGFLFHRLSAPVIWNAKGPLVVPRHLSRSRHIALGDSIAWQLSQPLHTCLRLSAWPRRVRMTHSGRIHPNCGAAGSRSQSHASSPRLPSPAETLVAPSELVLRSL